MESTFRKKSKVNLLYKFAKGIERNAVGCTFDGLVWLKGRPEVGRLVKRINVANDYKWYKSMEDYDHLEGARNIKKRNHSLIDFTGFSTVHIISYFPESTRYPNLLKRYSCRMCSLHKTDILKRQIEWRQNDWKMYATCIETSLEDTDFTTFKIEFLNSLMSEKLTLALLIYPFQNFQGLLSNGFLWNTFYSNICHFIHEMWRNIAV